MSNVRRPRRPSSAPVAHEDFKYVNQNSINEDLFCPICTDVFDVVKRTRRCNHLFCHACIVQALSRSKTCPICRSPCQESELQSAKQVQNDLDQLEVFCTYSPDCEWQGVREELRLHLLVACGYTPVACNEHKDHPDCKEVLPRKDIDKHRKECAFKMKPCPLNCDEKFYQTEEVEEHCRMTCVNREVECSQCFETMPFCLLGDHDATCPEKQVGCPHRNILGAFGGCEVEVKRNLLREHLRVCKFEPLKEALRGINMHIMALERRIELIQREYKDELFALSTLRLNAADVSGLEQLKNVLKYNPAVRRLHLLDFQPGISWQLLCEVLCLNHTVDTVSLKGSQIDKTGAVLLAQTLKRNSNIRSVILTDNNIGDQGVTFLSKAIDANKVVRHLDLVGNGFGDKGMELLCRALQNTLTIEVLDCGWNNIRPKGVECLARVIERRECNMHTLDLCNNEIGYRGVEFLAVALESNVSIRTLNLSNCHIGKGIEFLAHALEYNNSLQKLALASNNINDRGVDCLANCFRLNAAVHTLDLDGNLFGDLSLEHLLHAMEKTAIAAFAESSGFGNMMRTIYIRHTQTTREGLRRATAGVGFVRAVSDVVER